MSLCQFQPIDDEFWFCQDELQAGRFAVRRHPGCVLKNWDDDGFYLPTRFCNWWSLGEVWIVALNSPFCWISWLKVWCFHVVLHHSILYSSPRCFFAMFSHLLSQDIKLSDVETLPIRVCEDQGQNHLASNLTGVPKKLIVNTPHTQRQPVFRAGGFWLNKQNVKKWSNIAPCTCTRCFNICWWRMSHSHFAAYWHGQTPLGTSSSGACWVVSQVSWMGSVNYPPPKNEGMSPVKREHFKKTIVIIVFQPSFLRGTWITIFSRRYIHL